ncbi:HIT family protein [Streptosporangium sandarakinum]|uniref:HIT family protein n=2 Tax=Streptosporangium TaxID=2000 RepID=UPI0037BB4496
MPDLVQAKSIRCGMPLAVTMLTMGDLGGSDCVFCAILRGEAEASVPYADDRVMVIMDIGAVTPGHLLVIPRVHAVGLEDLDEETSAHVWTIGHRMGRALRRSGLRCEGVNVFLADGKAAFQEVFHFHLHVFPRFEGDSFRIDANWGTRARSLLDQESKAVRSGLAELGFPATDTDINRDVPS